MKMKKLIVSVLLCCALSLSACSGTTDAAPSSQETTAVSRSTADEADRDPYATENRYDFGSEMFEKRENVDYGTVLKDVSYYSSTAGDNKQCNILLPPDYSESRTYPVLYVFHGFGGSHNNQIDTDSYLTLLYGNMLRDHLTVPMIIVNADMYTDKLADKDSKTDEELRYIYDKAIDDMAVDLMPFIEKNYSVKTGRANTAVAGMSEGGAKALCTGFKWLDKFGYIGAFAPDTGVIPTEYFKGTFWNTPVFEKFPQPTQDNMPFYLYMAVGSKDPWNIDCTLYYRDVLNEMGVPNQTDLAEGYEHDYVFWRQCFCNYLSKLFA
jgi:enterochelin esterase-like enzyme